MGVWRALKKLDRPESEAALKLETPLATYFGPSLQIISPLAQQNATTSRNQHLHVTDISTLKAIKQAKASATMTGSGDVSHSSHLSSVCYTLIFCRP